MACRSCRSRKVKCDRTRPSCKNCMQRGNECIYIGERQRRRKPRKPDTSNADCQPQDTGSQSSTGGCDEGQERQSPQVFSQNEFLGMSDAASASTNTDSVRGRIGDAAIQPWQGQLLDQILDGNDVDPLEDRHPTIWMRTDDAEEYSGPSSGIAGISDLGLKWIQSRIPESDEVCRTIQYVRDGLLTHLRQCIPPQPSPNPEAPADWKPLPPPDTIREYVDTYFSTVQTIFPVIDATAFDDMLTQWYQKPSCQSDSWKALLNAVLASGCRAALSNDTASAFQLSGTESWGFFQNALNYEPKLVRSTTDLMSVQALVVMAVFAQGMSCSQRLEYILSSTAARLGHSLALNRHVPKQWRMSEREQRERYRLFWVIYCLDKSIALRSGRPPVIHDEDISCPFPRNVRYGTRQMVEQERDEPVFDFFLSIVKFYRVCSVVARELYSTSALRQSASQLPSAAEGILSCLESWRGSIPAQCRPGRPFSRIPVGNRLLRMQALVLHFSYYYAVCAIHRRFTPMFLQGHDDVVVAWPSQGSSVTHIEAARSIALLTKYLDMESYTPAWLLFYYPTTALATIFMHTVTAPLSKSAHSDIALMEAVAGFFGRLEFMTFGEAAFTKTSEFARQARRIVEMATKQSQDEQHAPVESDDPPSDRSAAVSIDEIDEDLPDFPDQTTAVEPISTTCQTFARHEDFHCSALQLGHEAAADPQVEWNHRNFGDISSTFRNNLTGSISLSDVDLPDGYWSNDWSVTNHFSFV